jgi:multiple antibiotic resistance protein
MSPMLMFIFTKAFQLFLVLDPLGNTGIIAALLSKIEPRRQRAIVARELSIALCIMLLMFFLGSYFLLYLNLSQAAVTMTGGIIFFLFAISLLFPGSSMVNLSNLDDEPFIVPIATPLIVGPSSIATIILYAHDRSLWTPSLLAVLLAWVVTAVIIFMGPWLLSLMGRTGMHVVERFIGLICALVAVKMLLKGLKLFIATLP